MVKYYIVLILSVISFVALPSCNTVKGLIGKEKTTTSTETNKINPWFQLRPKVSDSKSSSRGKRLTTATSTAKVETTAVTDIKPGFNATDSLAVVCELSGEWNFIRIHDISFKDIDNRPSITFDNQRPRFYATNGCNYFNGNYRVGEKGALTFDDVIATQSLCSEIEWGGYLETLWSNVKGMKISNNGTDKILELTDRRGTKIASLRRHNNETVNGMWDVTEINGRRVDPLQQTLVIDLIENSIHGHSGCNVFSGSIYQNPDIEMSMQFQDMSVTKHDTPGVEYETSLLVTLEQIERAIIIDNDNIILTGNGDRETIKLTRK